MSALHTDEAFERRQGRLHAPIVITCEHASERMPEPFRFPAADERLLGTHWAYDLGAREITLELAEALDASCVLSRFTRLLVDPNREESHGDLFRASAEGAPVVLNRRVSDEERELRLSRYYRPFHAAVDDEIARVHSPVLLSVHTFTPLYEGSPRTVQVGVLFNREVELAQRLGAALSSELAGVAYNEPWSGLDGLIYSAESHAERFGRAALEIEVRQDLALDRAYRARLVDVLVRHFA